MEAMLYKRHRQAAGEPGGYFHLEHEQNHRKAFGFGHGGSIKLEDTSGSIWRGTAERGDDQSIYYRFRNSEGRVVSGIGYGASVLLRDDTGGIWKGFVD